MSRDVDPSLNRRKLRVELRKARDHAGLTQNDAATALDWSLSKLNRIEKGTVSVSVTDLRALLAQYEVTDPDQVAELVEAARGSKGQAWWTTHFADVVSPRFAEYLGYETAATSCHTYQPIVIDGLLHTEDYAEALMLPEFDDSRHRRRTVELRTERQDRVFDDNGIKELHFILDEAALRRRIGEPSVMRQQLQHLKDMAAHPRVTLQALPFTAGAHLATQAPFVLLGFRDDDDLLYLENQTGSLATREDYDLVVDFQDCFELLTSLAYDEARTLDLIEEVREGFSTS